LDSLSIYFARQPNRLSAANQAADFTSVRLRVQTSMPEENPAPDLFDLKFLPAWVKEAPNDKRYADFAGEEHIAPGQRERRDRDRRGGDRHDRSPRPARAKERGRDPRERDRRPAPSARPAEREREEAPQIPVPAIQVRFLPDPRVLENVLAQIKAGHLAYSVFSLARMFLDKPERYDVRLQAESDALVQLGQNGPAAVDRRILENGAFIDQKDNFYRTEVTQSEPVKGSFSAVARCRLSGNLLGPTNHHAYQPQLRALYEQRFSRRMSFPDYQRQIEIVSDPAMVERWKEEARSLTTYTTLQEDPPLTFTSLAETERHFRQAYLPGLLRNSAELTLDGVVSRQLRDRSLGRIIENAWAAEFRSPTRMMQELIGALRQHGLHIFRHRKGMLFVSPVRARPFQHGSASVSSSVAGILAALSANPGIKRKQLLEKLLPNEATEDHAAEKKKLALASDLHWLIGEGHVIEFNDGALDLPRTKPPISPLAGGPNGGMETAASPDKSSGLPLPSAAEEASSADAASMVVERMAAASENGVESEQTEAGEKAPAAD
jgi:hypothetical protein